MIWYIYIYIVWCWLIKEAEKYYYWVSIHFGGLDSLEIVYLSSGLGSLEVTNKLNWFVAIGIRAEYEGTIVEMHEETERDTISSNGKYQQNASDMQIL